jgi:hypothetical protein
MPIVETSPKACFRTFAKHLHGVFKAVLGTDEQVRHLPPTQDGDLTRTRVGLFDSNDEPKALRLSTRFGPMFFSVDQLVCAIKESKTYRLETHSYAYKLTPNEQWETAALIRWEYEKFGPSKAPPRHHAQFAAKIAHGNGALDLNRLHTPTGWVTFEEVLRFLITELQVKPACEDWDLRISKAEGRFFTDFTSRRYHTPGRLVARIWENLKPKS